MDSSDLIILRHLLIEKSISGTARLMNLTQPAITMRLGKLRDMFKDELLVRVGNKMALTAKAEDMVVPVTRITNEMLMLMPDKYFDPKLEPTTVCLKISKVIPKAYIPMLIERFLAYHPEHKIHIKMPSYFSAEINEETIKQSYDAIIGLPNHLANYSDEIYCYDDCALLYDQYFDNPPESIDYETYLQLPHIAINLDDENNFLLDQIGRPDPRNVCIRVNDILVGVSLLKGNYVLTASRLIAQLYDKQYIQPPFEIPRFPFKLSYPTRLKHDQKNKWIRGVCNDFVHDALGDIILKG